MTARGAQEFAWASNGFWALCLAGIAIGGTGVWVVALAARVGVLRMLLELFPRPAWETVTWGLIPAMLLAPPALQGIGIAYLAAARPARVGRGVLGGLAGTLVAAALIGAAVLVWVRRLPPRTLAAVARGAPEVLIPLFAILVLAGWLSIAGRLPVVRWLRWGAFPLAVVIVALAWLHAHGHLMALSYVLNPPEMSGLFAAVALGGAVGSAITVVAGSAGAARRAASEPAPRAERGARHEPG